MVIVIKSFVCFNYIRFFFCEPIRLSEQPIGDFSNDRLEQTIQAGACPQLFSQVSISNQWRSL